MSFVTKFARQFIAKRKEPYTFQSPKNLDLKINNKKVGLYIHVPFCKEICDFCPYNKTVYNADLAQKYPESLQKELGHYRKILPSDVKITSVYIGGGSPTTLIGGINDILKFLRHNFNFQGDVGLEVHPRDANPRVLSTLQEIGITMISLGIQSFNKNLLHKVGRTGAKFSNKKVAKRAIDFGFKCVDIDLMFSDERPHTSLEDFKTTVELGADQISTYPLIPFSYTQWGEEYSSKHNFLLRQFRKRDYLNNFAEIAQKNAYRRTSIWSFTKKFSQRYSSITRYPFLGVGAGATSCIEDKFLVNTFSVPDYIQVANKSPPIALECNLLQRDREIWWLFWQLYNTKISLNEFKKLFNRSFKREFPNLVKIAKLLNYFEESGNKIYLSRKGINFFHVIELIYTRNYLETVWGKCLKEAWPDKIKLF